MHQALQRQVGGCRVLRAMACEHGRPLCHLRRRRRRVLLRGVGSPPTKPTYQLRSICRFGGREEAGSLHVVLCRQRKYLITHLPTCMHTQSLENHCSNILLRPISLAMATPIKITSISRSAPAKPAPSAALASSESARRSPSQSPPRSPASAPGSAAASASPARYHPPPSAAATVRRATPSASGAKPTTPLTR